MEPPYFIATYLSNTHDILTYWLGFHQKRERQNKVNNYRGELAVIEKKRQCKHEFNE